MLHRESNLFSVRATLAILDGKKGCSGIGSLSNMEQSRMTSMVAGMYKDVHPDIADQLKDPATPHSLLQAFWDEYGGELKLSSVQARLFVDVPPSVNPGSDYSVGIYLREISKNPEVRLSSEEGLKLNFSIPGESKGYFDDVCIFYPTSNEVLERLLYGKVMTSTTISFYYPSVVHELWARWAGISPPDLKLQSYRVNQVFQGNVSENLYCTTYGIG